MTMYRNNDKIEVDQTGRCLVARRRTFHNGLCYFVIIVFYVSLAALVMMYSMSTRLGRGARRPVAPVADVREIGIEEHVDKVKLYSAGEHGIGGTGNHGGEPVDLRIIVIGYNRAASLKRLLISINDALYNSARTTLEVWLDKTKEGVVDEKTLQTARSFNFRHGQYAVFTHSKHVGLYGQWLSTWRPQHNSSEIAVILQDDLVVSPYYYTYLKLVHDKYGQYRHINGFSLQGFSIKHSGDPGLVEGPGDHYVYLYPTLGTWGFSPNRRNWLDFVEWFSMAYINTNFEPLVPGHVSTAWYRTHLATGRAGSMWSIWHIYYAWRNTEFTLYPNFEDHKGLTVNFDEAGLHYDGTTTNSAQLDGLLTGWRPEYGHLPDSPPRLDNSGKVTNSDE